MTASRYDPADWEGRSCDGATLTFATPCNLVMHAHLRPLELEPLLWNGICLVCHRDLHEQAAIVTVRDRLTGLLQRQASSLANLERVR